MLIELLLIRSSGVASGRLVDQRHVNLEDLLCLTTQRLVRRECSTLRNPMGLSLLRLHHLSVLRIEGQRHCRQLHGLGLRIERMRRDRALELVRA